MYIILIDTDALIVWIPSPLDMVSGDRFLPPPERDAALCQNVLGYSSINPNEILVYPIDQGILFV